MRCQTGNTYQDLNLDAYEPSVTDLTAEKVDIEWPDGHPFSVFLSHDIDRFSYQGSFRGELAALRSVRDRNVKCAARYLMPWWRHPDLDLKRIMEMEKEWGVTSTFFFLAVERGSQDHSYDIEALEDQLKALESDGFEVGLHGSRRAYNDRDEMMKEKRALESTLHRPVTAYRNHYLAFDIPLTWKLLEEAGFQYDSTFGNTERVGFRGGLCRPFRPYDQGTGRTASLLEIPLNIMDCSLFYPYMRLSQKDAWDVTKALIDTAFRHHGVLTINWHNTFMFGDYLRFYQKMLGYCKEKDAWMTTGAQICEHYLTQYPVEHD